MDLINDCLLCRYATSWLASTAPAHDEQSHIVDWRTSLTEPGDIPQDAVGHSVGTLLKVISQGTDQSLLLVIVACRILRLRDAVGI